jgi:hypothetical protein
MDTTSSILVDSNNLIVQWSRNLGGGEGLGS